ncbi:hypothetical protein M409DRAFT_58662 [Zasmidium cellare ATCC 36951]|uniref:Mid2 domain-containing protein n=1 Tax=Zasmidium cellare ATCC 36951 TaxID=1080233 RepID=A0A6A6C4D3_ZASCE|nr:uncharacterized protein M409DRAFT_58662 [Zasmidium cellare ATCC 36951]KAF2161881.1 hypothetical protein M409DRAFT_58662 [Zasmidium cellare ATCC 36951]
MTQHTLIGALWLTLLTLAQGRDCFYPDHSRAEDYTQCNAEATQSACCHISSACLSNGLCLSQTEFANRITRGACTDYTYSNPACPSQCIQIQPNTNITLFPANVFPKPKGNGLFCCAGSYNSSGRQCQVASDSDGNREPFTLPVGSVIVDRRTGATLSDNPTTNSTSGSVVTVTAKSDSNVTAVGVGVGVSLGVLLLAALAGCVVLYVQLRKAKKELLHGVESKGAYRDMPKEHHENTVFSPPVGQQSLYADGTSKAYSYGSSQPPAAPVDSPFNNIVAEAPTERDVAMADSRPVLKP